MVSSFCSKMDALWHFSSPGLILLAFGWWDTCTLAICQGTRKDQKALEREILFHMIPDEQRAGYADALAKEWQTWCKYQAVAVLDTEASAHVLAHVTPERILATRVCYRNKNAAFPWMPIKYKARIVCRGNRDPDLLTLRRDAPTLARLSLMQICQLAASMVDWFMFNADITGAFLQGDQSLASRREPLYLRQPREGLPGLHRDQLMLVVRGIFGLANSPRLFWRHLCDSHLQLGFRQSMLDKALFLYYKNGQLILAIGVHVGDLFGTGKPGDADEILKKIRETFDFGAWADDREEKVLEYGGISRSHVKVVWSNFPRRSSSRLLLCLVCQSGGHRHQVQHWCRTRWRRCRWLLTLACGANAPWPCSWDIIVYVQTAYGQQLGEPEQTSSRSKTVRWMELNLPQGKPRWCQDRGLQRQLLGERTWDEVSSRLLRFHCRRERGHCGRRCSQSVGLEIPQNQAAMSLDACGWDDGDGCWNGCRHFLPWVAGRDAHRELRANYIREIPIRLHPGHWCHRLPEPLRLYDLFGEGRATGDHSGEEIDHRHQWAERSRDRVWPRRGKAQRDLSLGGYGKPSRRPPD